MAHILTISEQELLKLKAGFMEYPGDRVLAYFGPHRSIMKLLGVSEPTALEPMHVEIL